MKEITLKFTDN